MGNSHSEEHHYVTGFHGTPKVPISRLRRVSAPSRDYNVEESSSHPHHTSFSFGMSYSRGASPNSSTPPKIQINGMDSTNDLQQPDTVNSSPNLAHEMSDLTPIVIKNAATKRMEFLTSAGNLTVRSLDDGHIAAVQLEMKPLTRAKSLSPLKQMRTYSFRSLNSEENALDHMHCAAIHNTWSIVKEKCHQMGHEFGFLVFDRIFEQQPKLKTLFKVDEYDSLSLIPDDHEFIRHTRLFTNVLDIAVRNVDELEVHIAPILFKYGERHFASSASSSFNEETVRLFCGQVVCAVADLLGESVQPISMEAWIEMMRYLGRKLLDGYEFARISTKRRISINKNDHHLFLML